MTDVKLLDRLVELADEITKGGVDRKVVADAFIGAGLAQERQLYGPLAVAERLFEASKRMAGIAAAEMAEAERHPQRAH